MFWRHKATEFAISINEGLLHRPHPKGRIALHCIIKYCFVWYGIVLFCIVLYCTLMYGIVLYFNVWYYTVLLYNNPQGLGFARECFEDTKQLSLRYRLRRPVASSIFKGTYCTVLYYKVLFCFVWFGIVLYCIVLYCTLMYGSILYYHNHPQGLGFARECFEDTRPLSLRYLLHCIVLYTSIVLFCIVSLKKIEWIIHSIYGVNTFHSLRNEYHSILTPVEWKFTTQRMESRPVHSIFTPKEVITSVTTQGVTTVTHRVKIHSIFF